MDNKGWVWFASRKTVALKQVSALAAFEIFVSFSLAISAAVYFDGFQYLVWAVVAAPLAMLRSDEAVISAHKYFERAEKRPHRFQLYGVGLCIVLLKLDAPVWVWILVLLNGMAIGIVFNSWYVQLSRSIYYIREGVKCLPENFYRNMLIVDLAVEPEPVPELRHLNSVPGWNYRLFRKIPRNPIYLIAAVNIT